SPSRRNGVGQVKSQRPADEQLASPIAGATQASPHPSRQPLSGSLGRSSMHPVPQACSSVPHPPPPPPSRRPVSLIAPSSGVLVPSSGRPASPPPPPPPAAHPAP